MISRMLFDRSSNSARFFYMECLTILYEEMLSNKGILLNKLFNKKNVCFQKTLAIIQINEYNSK